VSRCVVQPGRDACPAERTSVRSHLAAHLCLHLNRALRGKFHSFISSLAFDSGSAKDLQSCSNFGVHRLAGASTRRHASRRQPCDLQCQANKGAFRRFCHVIRRISSHALRGWANLLACPAPAHRRLVLSCGSISTWLSPTCAVWSDACFDSMISYSSGCATQATKPWHDDDPFRGRPGTNRFLYQKVLGEGGYGVVVQAYDKMLSCRVAVKLFENLTRSCADVLVTTLAEVTTLCGLAHPSAGPLNSCVACT
jgi:hypothetical protein